MKSASAMSAMIRAKKKKMEEEDSDAVKLSGIPEDATDLLILKNKEPGERLSEHTMPDRDEDPTLEELEAKSKAMQPHEEEAPDSHEPYGPDGMKVRKDKIRKMMGRMRT